jgi:hypothetical protein
MAMFFFGVLFLQMAAGSIEHEGPEMGVGDFVLLSEITMDAFVKNLQLRLSRLILLDQVKSDAPVLCLDLKRVESTRTSARFVERQKNRLVADAQSASALGIGQRESLP